MGVQRKINKMAKKLLKSKVKVNPQELHNIKLRTMLKEQKEFELYVVRNEMRQYINLVLQKYEKTGAEYQINLETGEIMEVEVPQGQEAGAGVAAAQERVEPATEAEQESAQEESSK